jgi:hypothetical protein
VLATGAVAATLSTYPVVFFGRSFTAPQFWGVPLIYPSAPYVPGGDRDAPNEDVRYADVGAFPWQFRPWTVIEAHAVLDAGEFPLWDRYDYSGIPLLGQGNTEMADPLNWLVVAGRGSAIAWDVKFVLAKALFVMGNALLAFVCVRSLPISLAIGGSSAFIGIFLVRINHAVFFTTCYAPWLLLAWVCLAVTRKSRVAIAAIFLLIISNVIILGSGAIKEGGVMCVSLDASGAVMVLLARLGAFSKLCWLGLLTLVGIATVLLSFPIWASFFATLSGSITASDVPGAKVLPLSLLGGLFDDSLYVRVALQRFPSLNLFLGLSILWAVVSFRQFAQDRVFIGLLLGAALPALFAYGIIPPTLVARIPFIGNIGHVHDAFTAVIIVYGAAIAAFGLRAMLEFADVPRWWSRCKLVSLLLLALVASAAFVHVNVKRVDVKPILSDLTDWRLWSFIIVLVVMTILVAPLLRRVATTRGRDMFAVFVLILSMVVIHIRDGMHLDTGNTTIDRYALRPGPRPDFSVPSPSLASLPDPAADPFRIIGVESVLFPGYSGALGLENMQSVDPLIPTTYRALLSSLHYDWSWTPSAADLVRLSAALDFLNVRYLVSMPVDAAPLAPLPLVANSDLEVFQRPTAWPRAYFTDDVRSYDTLAELALMIENAGGKPFAAFDASDKVLHPSTVPAGGFKIVAARDYRLTADSTGFVVDAPGPGIIVLGEQYFDGFTVTVNDTAQPVLRVNAIYKGIAVTHPGTYSIEFVFNPRYWRLTPYIMMIGCIFVLAIIPTTRSVLSRPCVLKDTTPDKLRGGSK